MSDRRDFLRDASVLLTGALTVTFASAFRMVGDEVVYPIPAQDGATIDREHEVMVVRHQDRVYAFALWCPHQRTALRWEEAERRFRCPKHKSTFQPDGAFVSGRATRALDRYALGREGDTVVVDLSAILREDEDAERWGQAVVQL